MPGRASHQRRFRRHALSGHRHAAQRRAQSSQLGHLPREHARHLDRRRLRACTALSRRDAGQDQLGASPGGKGPRTRSRGRGMVGARSRHRGAALERSVVRLRRAVAPGVPRPRGCFAHRRHADPRGVSRPRQGAPPMKILDPATGAAIADAPEDGPASVRKKYERARAAQPAWAATPLSKRLASIAAFRERIVAMQETLARTLTREVGKPIRQSRNELKGLLLRLDFFLAEAERALHEEKVYADEKQHLEERISHEPLGVIANISAWNYPYFVGSNVFVPALIAGNAVLYKPSEFATLTGLHIEELLHEAGIPEDVFIAVTGGGATGAALLRQPVDGVFFTGSYATGAKIAAIAGRKMI